MTSSDVSKFLGPIGATPNALFAHRERRPPQKKKNFGLTVRVKAAIEFIVFGFEDDVVTAKKAAELAGISERSLREALSKPAVLDHYRKQMAALRNGERGNNFRTAVQIRDDKALAKSASGQRVRLAAAAMLDADLMPTPANQGQNNGVTVNVVIPGYVLDLREADEPKPVQQIEHLERHDVNALISLEDVQT
jgi:hypothetical protein